MLGLCEILFLGALTREVTLQLRTHFFEGLALPALDLFKLDDVKTEGAAHRLTHLSGLQGVGGVLEGLVHHTAAEKAEVAALFGRAWVLRKFARKRREILALAHTRQYLLNLIARRVELHEFGICTHLNQDMARAAFFKHSEIRFPLFILLAQFGLRIRRQLRRARHI